MSEAPAPAADPAPSEPIDSFALVIEAERWGVLIDRAIEGVRFAPESAESESDAARTDRALKYGALRLVELRNNVCAAGVGAAEDCAERSWPDWILRGPEPDLALTELKNRSDWLGGELWKFVDIGCSFGKKGTGDDMFCSVE